MKDYENLASTCYKVVELYQQLLTSYVLDFYVEDHWHSKLPNSWREFLDTLCIQQTGDLLSCNNSRLLPPLSVLCIQQITRSFAVDRTQVVNELNSDGAFMKHFRKKVKLKKLHEIEIMSKICHKTALQMGCTNVVDIGSGLGHLSRLLAFRYGLNVCTFEANEELVKLAPKYDEDFASLLAAKDISHKCLKAPKHICQRIDEGLTSKDFEAFVKNAFNINQSDNIQIGIVGLHPCGNLGSTLLRLFNDSSYIKFINIASCCYMKLSLNSNLGYPLSSYLQSKACTLDYLSCETACHAIEQFIVKIKSEQECTSFKIHSYRAALEHLIHKYDNSLRHSAMGNVKCGQELAFSEYCTKATERYNLDFLKGDLNYFSSVIERTWKDVVKFYSCRLLLAPLVESVILYDRFLYLIEGGHTCDIIPAFDCSISPRCHIIQAVKRNLP